jgi:AcrR family transcriptional regulator
MTKRPYRLGQRQTATELTRMRIVSAARDLLAAPDGVSGFTVDAVADQSGVARMTVYNQFGSKVGLLEALFDDLAARGLVTRLRSIFGQAEPRQALDGLITAFGSFWSSDRIVIRRIRGLASIDQDIERVLRARDERRREILRGIVGRLVDKDGHRALAAQAEVIDVLHTLTSFETFDALAVQTRGAEEVITLVRRLAYAVLGLNETLP